MKITLRRTSSVPYQDAVVEAGELVFEQPMTGATRGAIKKGDGVTAWKDLPYILEPGEGPSTPDLAIATFECLAEMLKIRKELKEKGLL